MLQTRPLEKSSFKTQQGRNSPSERHLEQTMTKNEKKLRDLLRKWAKLEGKYAEQERRRDQRAMVYLVGIDIVLGMAVAFLLRLLQELQILRRSLR